MLDIIIPVYNDIHNLSKTLYSLTTITCPIQVYIIDDCSANLNNFDEIINMFNPLLSIKINRLPQNSGPGAARQKGLEISSNPFILFVDCGDIVVNGNIIEDCLNQSINYKFEAGLSFNVLAENYDKSYNVYGEMAYNLKSIIIKRLFLEQFCIKFNLENSYYFEDIGFIRQIYLIINSTDHFISHINNSLIIYTWYNDSLVRKNNSTTLYQNIESEAKNCIFAIEQVRSFCDNNTIEHTINESLICIYASYMEIQYTDKDYLCYAERSLQTFLQKYYNCNNLTNNENLFQAYQTIAKHRNFPGNLQSYNNFIAYCKFLL